jgi:hypothetical protein
MDPPTYRSAIFGLAMGEVYRKVLEIQDVT